MSMFNWQASGTDRVLSSRFWIYWAVTLPLTLLVFSVWLFWLHQHKKHEPPKSLDGIRNLQTRPRPRVRFEIDLPSQSPRPGPQADAKIDEADAEAGSQSIFSIGSGSMRYRPSQRADNLMQGPRRWCVLPLNLDLQSLKADVWWSCDL